jgi:hypothetical protein
MVRMDDADAGTNTMDMPFRFYPCFAAGSCLLFVFKKSTRKSSIKNKLYEEEFEELPSTDEDRASFRIRPSSSLR